jgi:hypothetical protein
MYQWLEDICWISDLVDVVCSFLCLERIISLPLNDWLLIRKTLTDSDWKLIYEKKYYEFTPAFVIKYQKELNKPSYYSRNPKELWSFTLSVVEFSSIKPDYRYRWVEHCLIHSYVRLIDVPYDTHLICVLYRHLLTLEDKYTYHHRYNSVMQYTYRQYSTIHDRELNQILIIRSIFGDYDRVISHIKEIDVVRKIKDRTASMDELKSLTSEQSYILEGVMSLEPKWYPDP